ncbi:MAG: alpha/beta fold hydrolase [Gluconacetobacter diazotrophicus]|nr:alpha/beta fold hydrolase [Gluconacetobacter diazotrophicus]
MKLGFQDNSFAFELVRNLGFIYYGGADLGEMMATAETVVEGDLESWYAAWHARGELTLQRAEASLHAGSKQSAKEGFLRASTYFRMAEFYLHGNPDDPRILGEARASQAAYAAAAALIGPTWEPVEIPYENTTLPGWFYKVDDSDTPRPTLVFHGGYDSSIEELFFYGGAPAVRRGYNCLTFDGPGQGMPMREGKLPFRFDWEKVVTPAVDYLLTRPDVDGNKLALKGMSLGGYLAARAAAFEPRFKAVILFDGVWDYQAAFKGLLPPDALAAYERGDAANCERITRDAMRSNTTLRWAIDQGIWSYAATGVADLVDKLRDWAIAPVVDRISCPCLVMDAEGDQFFGRQPRQVYDALSSPKEFVRFTKDDGAENHCQSGALAFKDQVVFDWLDRTLGHHG